MLTSTPTDVASQAAPRPLGAGERKETHLLLPADILEKVSHTNKDNIAVSIDGRKQTYGQMFERACRLSNALRALGVEPGERVATLMDNCYETVEIIAGTALGNYPRATLYSYFPPATNAYLLSLVGASVLIVDQKYYAGLREHLGKVSTLRHVVIVDDGFHGEETIRYEDLIGSASEEYRRVEASPDDVHIIRFSSGTTGLPKGISHSIRRWMESSAEYRWVTPMMDEKTRYLVPGSIAHVAGSLVWGVLSVGGTFVLMRSFNACKALDLIEQERITYVALVPVMIKEMLESPDVDQRDLSSLECIFYAGSPISPATLRRAIAVFGNVLYQLYAQSELIPVTMLTPNQQQPDGDAAAQNRLRSVGRATPNVLLTIRDDQGNVLPNGETGEVAAIAPGAMSGIWGDEVATKERILDDGSVLTGDVGVLDEDGYLFLLDRKNDMIISGGYNIWPAELEQALESHPQVAEACVVGIPHEKWGETPHAAVVLRESGALSESEVMAYVRELVGPVKKLTSVEFVRELPRSAVGKIQRHRVRDPFWAAQSGRIRGV
ncbi:class I adenylate-forming enzyme family protein [bacterium RCC_150]